MNLSQIRQEASRQLRENGDGFGKLVLIHTAVTAGASLLLMLVAWLSQYIAPEGGLSNMGTQTLLSTGQTLLQLVNMIAVPFWDAGLIFCSLRLLRNRSNAPGTLTEGFRRWGPIASSLGIRGLIYFVTSMACSFVSSIFLSVLPLPPSVVEELTAFAEAPALPLSSGVRIFLVLYLVVYSVSLCVLLIPKLYQHRLVIYRIMDDEPCGGLQAVLHSRILMKGNRRKLFLLDLSFWWFYLLELGITVLSMGDLILAEIEIALPMSAEAAAWVFPIAALVARLVLYWQAKPKLAITYGVFYQKVFDESLKEPEPPQPKRMPWKY